jgi:hypothetical protein
MLEISEEIKDLFAEAEASQECRDACIKQFFGWKRAAYFAKRQREYSRKAWKAAGEIYPEVKTGSWFYHCYEGVIKQGDGKDT